MNNINEKFKIRKSLLILICLGYLSLNINGAYSNKKFKTQIGEKDFERSLNTDSSQFQEYENAKNLFDDFFGLSNPTNETSYKTNFQDLSLQVDSKILRDLYEEKLESMTKQFKKNDKKKDEWSFFDKKI